MTEENINEKILFIKENKKSEIRAVKKQAKDQILQIKKKYSNDPELFEAKLLKKTTS